MGHKLKYSGDAVKRLYRLHQIWYKSVDSSGNSGNGNRLNPIRPSIPQGVLGGSQIQKSGEAVKQLD